MQYVINSTYIGELWFVHFTLYSTTRKFPENCQYRVLRDESEEINLSKKSCVTNNKKEQHNVKWYDRTIHVRWNASVSAYKIFTRMKFWIWKKRKKHTIEHFEIKCNWNRKIEEDSLKRFSSTSRAKKTTTTTLLFVMLFCNEFSLEIKSLKLFSPKKNVRAQTLPKLAVLYTEKRRVDSSVNLLTCRPSFSFHQYKSNSLKTKLTQRENKKKRRRRASFVFLLSN